MPATYDAPGFWLSRSAMYREYSSAHGVKLSLHGSGFVQFSRAGTTGVLAGKDPQTGRPRGCQRRLKVDPFPPGGFKGSSQQGCESTTMS